MAKIVPADASAISGRRGGIVYSHNRNGYYTRAFVTPVNPRTSTQTIRRSWFGDSAQLWRGLTDAQRTGWSSQAANINRTDRVGLTYNLTGLQLFIGNNQNRLLVGQARVTNAPSWGTLPTWSFGAITILDDGTFDVAYTAGNIAASRRFYIYASAPVSAGRSFIRKSELRFITSIASNAASPLDLYTAYEAVHGAIGTGQVGLKIFLKVVPVDDNFYEGPAIETSAVVDAAP